MNLTKKIFSQNPKAIDIWSWGILGLLSILFFMIYGNLAQDDAYITFRYARNIAFGKGFVYNDGEWVLGTTTPLFTIFLALVSYISKMDVVRISAIISSASLWISAGILYELRKSLGSRGAFYLALIFITNPFLRNFIGMESYFLLCIFMLTIWAYQKKKMCISSFLNGFLILIRYEMIFLAIIIGTRDYIKNRKLPYWILPGLILVFIWLVYATIVFRSPIPLSASAKLLAPRIPFLVGGAVYWYQILSQIPGSFIIIFFSFLGIFGILFFNQLFNEYIVITLFSGVYLVLASIYAGSFPWYYAPLVPGFAITVILGVNYFSHFPTIDKMKLSEERKRRWTNGIQLVSVICLVTVQLVFWGKDHYLYQDKIGDDRFTPYMQVVDWINENATREQSIASFEIGYVGYFTDMKIIDLAGLITPALFPWVDEGAETSLFHALRLLTPDFVLIPNNNIKQKEIINDDINYKLVETAFDSYFLFKRK